MNASSVSPSPVLNGDNNIGSDSDTNPDQESEHYQPISPSDGAGDESEDSDGCNSDDEHHGYLGGSGYHTLDNGHCSNEMSSLRINDDGSDEKSSDEEEEDEGGRMREAMVRAFREDERRRNAPLTEENATRIVEAMRGVSFGGWAPDWAGQVSEDQWIDRLRRLGQSPNASGSSVHN